VSFPNTCETLKLKPWIDVCYAFCLVELKFQDWHWWPFPPRISPFVSGPDHWKLSCHVLSSSSCLGLLEVPIKPLASRGGLCKCHCKAKDGSKNWESWNLLPHTSGVCFVPPLREGRSVSSLLILCHNGGQLNILTICLGFTKGFLKISNEKSWKWVSLTRIAIQKSDFCFKMVDFLAH